MYKICVYTCITGDYDDLKYIKKEAGIDYICFTNNRNLKSDCWDIKYIEDHSLNDVLLARKIKILVPEYIKERYDISIWIDGAIEIRNKITDFLQNCCDLDHYDMVVFNHSKRNCVYKEADSIVEFRKEDIEKVRKAVAFLKRENYPLEMGLTETGIMVRKTKSELLDKAMILWFDLLKKYTKRDQLMFDYSIYKKGIKIKRLNYSVYDNPWFVWKKHNAAIPFDVIRVVFGEFNSIEDDNFCDVNVVKCINDKYIYSFKVSNDCNHIKVYLGGGENLLIKNFDSEDKRMAAMATNCVMSVKNSFLLSEDPLIIEWEGNYKEGDDISFSFELVKLKMEDYRQLLITKNNELLELSKRNLMMNEELVELRKEIDITKQIMNNKKELIKILFGKKSNLLCGK